MDSRPHLFVTAAGTATAFGLIRSVRDRFGDEIRISACDIFPAHLIPASTLADEFWTSPRADGPEFLPFIATTIELSAVQLFVPILDEEIVQVSEAVASGGFPSVQTAVPSADGARLAFDKLALAAHLHRHEIPTPVTRAVADAAWDELPLFYKPRHGRGSVGAREISNTHDLKRLEGEDGIVQPVCEFPETTVDAWISRDASRLVAVCRDRLETKAGVCTKARVYIDDALTALARRLVDALELRGLFCFQVMRDPVDGRLLVTDVNPRTGGGTRLSVAAGIDLHSAFVADMLGFDAVDLDAALPRSRYVCRQYMEFVTG